MSKTVTITLEDATIIRRWFLPHNPNKIRRPRDVEGRQKVQAACRRFFSAMIAGAGEQAAADGQAALVDFPARQVPVTMTGAQWTALLARIAHSTPKAGLFSAEGARVYNEASGELQRQLLAASNGKAA